jgi:glycosyltransferase involved in cell wall biosynthesis
MSSTKNIVIVIPDLKGNGAERVMMTLAAEFQARGHSVTLVCFKDVTELATDTAFRRVNFPMNTFRWIPRALRGRVLARLLDAFIRRHAGMPDLVLSNLEPADRIMSHSRLPGVHLVIHNTMSLEHGPRLRGKNANSYKAYLDSIYKRKPSVAVSAGVRTDFRLLFPGAPDCTHIYNPVDVDFIRRMAVGEPFLPNDYLMHVGGFKHAKRHDLLVQAYARSGVTTPLVLVGKGGLEAAVREQVAELGLTERVIFAGFHANPYPLIAGAKAMILSSEFEGLAIVLLEAMSLGVPAVSTDCPSGPGEFLPPRNLVPPGDVDALARLIAAVDERPRAHLAPLQKPFTPAPAAQSYLDLIDGQRQNK